ncbi:acylphosphatase-like [Oryza brachyantha]|uniref:acylphosphatase-like n=1 Tax=Oryza brachyantha TaxID=4533 RepID=UPI001ADA7B92|nr:acylphosphatase-like [Oryza brachyantha]
MFPSTSAAAPRYGRLTLTPRSVAAARRAMAASATPQHPPAPPPPPEPSPPNPNPKAVRVVVKGRVQGVFFRDWTVQTARALGLAGWVRNRRDGSVEALLSGDPAKVDEMVSRRLPVGPPAAAVTAVVPAPTEPVDPAEGFNRKPTA